MKNTYIAPQITVMDLEMESQILTGSQVTVEVQFDESILTHPLTYAYVAEAATLLVACVHPSYGTANSCSPHKRGLSVLSWCSPLSSCKKVWCLPLSSCKKVWYSPLSSCKKVYLCILLDL